MNGWEIRRSTTRGAFSNDWLDARFSLSFAGYDDPSRRRFGPLLALNEDRVRPGTGFPMHPHRDLEIVMLPLAGVVEHHDDRSGHGLVRPGQWQWMRAGSGIRHRQWNPSEVAPDHHLQIWLEPPVRGLSPKVALFDCGTPDPGAWRTLVSRQPSEGAQDIGVDVTLRLGKAAPDRPLPMAAHAGGRYLHLIDGHATVVGEGRSLATLDDGDALVFFDGVPPLVLQASAPSRWLAFDTAAVDRHSGLTLDRT